MTARLFCKVGALKGSSFQIKDDVHIGRAEGNQVVLVDKLISSKHARLFRDERRNCFVLEDLDSLNGTLLDGAPVKGKERLGHLHVLNFGGSGDFFFVDAPHAESKPGEGTSRDEEDVQSTFFGQGFAPIPSALSSEEAPKDDKNATFAGTLPGAIPQAIVGKIDGEVVEPAATKAVLIVNLDKGRGEFLLTEGENVIGRGSNADLVVESTEISRRHAVVVLRGGQLSIRDLGSTNRTYVEGARVESEKDFLPGAELSFGKTKATVELRES